MTAQEAEALVDGYGADVYRFCMRLTGGREAEDLYQDTFLRLMQMDVLVDASQNPRGLLFSIAYGLWRNMRRKLFRRQAVVQPMEDDFIQSVPSADDTAQTIIDRERWAKLAKLVACLPEKQKTPIVLYYGFDMQLKEISMIMEISAGTVKSRLHKGRQLIKEQWGGWEDEQ